MSENDNSNDTKPETKPSPLSQLSDTIKTAVVGSGEKIKQIYVDAQVQKEVNKRVDLLTKLVEAITGVKKNLSKIKADNITYNEDGSVAGQTFSKQVVENRKKLIEALQKGEKALDLALNSNDYSNTEQIINQLSQLAAADKGQNNKQEVKDVPAA